MEEMWRQRELENKATRDKYSRRSRNEHSGEGSAERDRYAERRNANEGASRSSSSDQDEDGLRDEDIEKFLHSKCVFVLQTQTSITNFSVPCILQ